MEQVEDYTAQERAALVAVEIWDGNCYTTQEIAERTGLTWHGAHHMMAKISRVLPLVQEQGRWKRFEAM